MVFARVARAPHRVSVPARVMRSGGGPRARPTPLITMSTRVQGAIALEEISDEELVGLDPMRARDLVVRCFYNAQRETLSRAATRLGSEAGDADLRRVVEGAVRLSFRSTQGDFERPTKAPLAAAVESLAEKAASMGTPRDIIEHHRKQLGRLFAALAD